MSVYFIVAQEVGLVKIGFSKDPWRRFCKLQTDSPVPVELACFVEGDEAVEAQIHARYESARVRGEWFKLSAVEPLIRATPAFQRQTKVRAVRTRSRKGVNRDSLHIYTDVIDFCTRNGMTISRFGKEALKDACLVQEMREGRKVYPQVEHKIRSFMASYRADAA